MMHLTKKIIALLLLLLATTVNADTLDSRLKALFNNSNNGEDVILDPDIAFKITARLDQLENDRVLILHWDIAAGYYLYRAQFDLVATNPDTKFGTPVIPAGVLKQDEAFGAVYVHYDQVVITVPIHTVPASAKTLGFIITYQGCKEGSVCYPPIKKRFDLAYSAATYKDVMPTAKDVIPTAKTAPEKKAGQDTIAERLQTGGFLLNLFSFFMLGFLLSLTPCIFPMVPILSSVIVGQGSTLSTRRAFTLTVSFVLAMAAAYAVLGVIAGSFDINLQAASQHASVIIIFSAIFILLALAMFGFYELQLPDMIRNRLNMMAGNQQGGSIKGVAIMGALSAIVVSPCVAPPLAGALLYISQTGDALLGGAALFFMGLGFGVPLLIVGISAGRLLPKAGQWMNAVRSLFGVIMLGVAIWLLERVFTAAITLMLWAALFIITAVYMGALEQLTTPTRWSVLKKGLGILLFIYGVIVMVGAVTGGDSVTTPLKRTNTVPATKTFTFVNSEAGLDRALTEAQQTEKPVLLYFYAHWCTVCKQMERSSFPSAEVQQLLTEFALLKVDVTENNRTDQALLKRFDLFGPPGFILFDRHGQERRSHRVVGFIEATAFAQHLKEVVAF